jgi:hypothetical protein
MYHKLRNDKEVCFGSDDSIYFYAVSAKWMAVWRKFANGETSQPGMINNKVTAEKIHHRRAKASHKVHDNDVKM